MEYAYQQHPPVSQKKKHPPNSRNPLCQMTRDPSNSSDTFHNKIGVVNFTPMPICAIN